MPLRVVRLGLRYGADRPRLSATMHDNVQNDVGPALSETQSLADFENALLVLYGPVLGGRELSRALGFPSAGAFAKARQRQRVPIRTFTMPGRRGCFAATADLAAWLWRFHAHP